MSWSSGKNPVYRMNTTRLTKSQQEDFLRNYMKMDSHKLSQFKRQLGSSRLLDGGKTVTQTEFTKTLEQFHKGAHSKFNEYLKDMDNKYETYKEETKAANIKKVRKQEMKREMADEKVMELIGSGRDEDRGTSIYDRIKKKKEREMTPEERRERKKLERTMGRRLEITNMAKTQWQHAEQGKTTSIHEAQKSQQSSWGSTVGSGQAAVPKKAALRATDADQPIDISKLKEESKNLPDLQI